METLILNAALMVSITAIVLGIIIHLRYPNTVHKKTLYILAVSFSVIAMSVNPTKYWDIYRQYEALDAIRISKIGFFDFLFNNKLRIGGSDYVSLLSYDYKRQCFTGVPNLTIVTPSQWLADLVKQSFLKDYDTVVINNGIDVTKFKPRATDFRLKHGLESKIILLGVAFDWTLKKGLDDFKRLAEDLSEEYAIVLIGVSEAVAKTLPDRIISIACTQNQEELAEIYSAADIFVNPTWEDNFPTVNLEALACGTPIVTYKTGGSPESITESTGKVVPYKDYIALKNAIVDMKDDKASMSGACMERAKLYEQKDAYCKYIELYKSILEK